MLVCCAAGLSAQGVDSTWRGKLDPLLGLRYERVTKRRSLPRLSAGEAAQRVIVRLIGPDVPTPGGLTVLARRGPVIVGSLSLDRLPALAADPTVATVKLPERMSLQGDVSMTSLRAERVAPRLGLTGKGVIIGVLDTGIDWRHPDFIGPDGQSRILAALDLSDSPDSLRAGDLGEPSPYGGVLYTHEMIQRALAGQGNLRLRDYVGHGTFAAAVAGATAHADPYGLVRYGGVAPEADFVIVKSTLHARDPQLNTDNGMLGVAFLDSLARALGRPYVANFSFGDRLGPHDGTDDEEQFLAAFIQPGRQGAVMVAAAGNDRDKKLHAAGDFSLEPDSLVWLELKITSALTGPEDMVRVQVWLSHGHPGLAVEVEAPDGARYGPFQDNTYLPDNLVFTAFGTLLVDNAFGGPNPFNGDRLINVVLLNPGHVDSLYAGAQPVAKGTWRIGLHSASGRFDAYINNFSEAGQFCSRFETYVSEYGTVIIPATLPEIITVGAHVARPYYPTLDPPGGDSRSYITPAVPGALGAFSSLGPNRAGVLKPDLTSPGQLVLAAASRDADPLSEPLSMFGGTPEGHPLFLYTPDTLYGSSQGTSFSCPYVSGLCALLLQADPSLDQPAIKRILIETATSDSATGVLPDNMFGNGRANAVGAVRRVLGITRDSVTVRAEVSSPQEPPYADSLYYTVHADFSGSAQVPAAYSFRVTYPPEALTPELRLDSLGRALEDTLLWIASTPGVLTVRGILRESILTRDSLFRVLFHPVGTVPRDSVMINLELLSLTGDLEPYELRESTMLAQSAPVSLGVSSVCWLRGDLDRNGRHDVFDLLGLLKVLAGVNAPSDCSDLDRNGKTDIFDLLALLKLL